MPKQKLRETEEQEILASIVDNSDDAIISKNLEGTILSWNKGAERIYGYTPEEVLGQSISILIPPDHPDEMSSILGRLKLGKRIDHFETERVRKDGTYLNISLVISPIKDKKGIIIGASTIAHDITGRKKNEEELRRYRENLEDLVEKRTKELKKSEERHRELYENAPNAYLSVGIDRIIRECNKAAVKLLGYTKEELTKMNLLDIYYNSTDGIDKAKIMFQRFLNSEKIQNEELQMKRKNGTPIWISLTVSPVRDEAGQITETHSMIIDISKRKKAELKLKDSKHDLTERVKELTCLYGLSKLVESPKISQETILRRTLDLIPPAMQFPEITCARINFDEKEFKTSNFKETDWKLSTNNIVNEKVLILEVYYLEDKSFLEEEQHLIYDIGHRLQLIIEKKEAEQELVITLENTKKLNRELQEFAYIASHDLQEPLRMVISFTQLIAKKLEDKLDDDTKDFINYAVDGATRMKQLINDLLSYSRVTTRGETFKNINIEKIIEEIILNLQPQIKEADAKITYGEFPSLLTDRTQILQLFQNLISNAIKFRSKENPLIHISVKRVNQEMIFSIEDNGMGIEKRFFDKIFIIFQRLHTRNEYPGTGIGLAICKKIVERLDGRIWVESEVGKGTIFKFAIPTRK